MRPGGDGETRRQRRRHAVLRGFQFVTLRLIPGCRRPTGGTSALRMPRPRHAYLAEQGVGVHPVPSGSFLKSELVVYGRAKYRGSSTLLITVSQRSPFGSTFRSQYSVTMARSLYGAPFLRT